MCKLQTYSTEKIMSTSTIQLGLRANWQQFTWLVIINAFVGAMIGLERTLLPLLAEQEFKLLSKTAGLSFLITFGLVKALTNLAAGWLGDQVGRKKILVIGWLIGLPVPLLIMVAPHWSWIIIANILLGINQGLCWSTTVIMKIDLVGSQRRGLAMGLNEFAGYLAVSLSAWATGYLAGRYGLRPIPFYPGLLIGLIGLTLSLFVVHETRPYAQLEGRAKWQPAGHSFAQIFWLTSWRNRTLFAVSQAGLVNNLNDGVVWAILPLFLLTFDLPLGQIGFLAALYPAVWGLSQLASGPLSDKLGRKPLIVAGMWVQAVGIALLVGGQAMGWWLTGVVVLGLGTAMVYPTLLAAVSDVAHPEWRSSAVGVYRLWRDSGYALGAFAAGLLADGWGLVVALWVIAAVTFGSGMVAAAVMTETLVGGE